MIDQILKRAIGSTLTRYIFAGGLSFAIELSIILLLIKALNTESPVAITIGFWVGLIVSFLLQKLLTFKDTRLKLSHLSTQTFYYGALVLVNYIFTLAFTLLAAPLIGLVVARTLALVITTAWNFVIYKRIIFN